MAVEGNSATGYSRIRVAFDVDKTGSLLGLGLQLNPAGHLSNTQYSYNSNNTTVNNQYNHISTHPQSPNLLHNSRGSYNMPLSPRETSSLASSSQITSTHREANQINQKAVNNTNNVPKEQIFIGDIGEPFWIQDINKDNSVWIEPDDLFINSIKKLITVTDKRVFWEMIKMSIDLPQLASNQSKSGFRSKHELGSILKRTENKVLWTLDGAEGLPKEILLELLSSAYMIPVNTYDK